MTVCSKVVCKLNNIVNCGPTYSHDLIFTTRLISHCYFTTSSSVNTQWQCTVYSIYCIVLCTSNMQLCSPW